MLPLVITIIVLLILAGITIAQLSGNNLFENAKLAKEKYKQARESEDETLEDYEDAITGDRGNKANYSTEEHVIGTWIDNNPLYEKTMELDSLSAGDNDFSLPQVKEIISVEGFGYGSDGWRGFYDSGNSTSTYSMISYFNPSSHTLRLNIGSGRASKAVITIRYTKTTD